MVDFDFLGMLKLPTVMKLARKQILFKHGGARDLTPKSTFIHHNPRHANFCHKDVSKYLREIGEKLLIALADPECLASLIIGMCTSFNL